MDKIEPKYYIPPTKFPKFLEAMKKVLKDDRTVILTDVELHILVNQQLKSKDRVSFKTFERWKSPTSKKNVEGVVNISEEEAEDFRQVLAYARVRQKMDLTGNMMDENNRNQWGSSWILERKFKDLKNTPQIQLNSNPTIQIEASNQEHKALIDKIINGDIEEIDHEEIKRLE